jgi:hypothetical protein
MRSNSIRLSTGVLGVALLCMIGGSAAIGQRYTGCTIVNGTRTAMIMLQIKESNSARWQAELLNRRPLGVQKEATFHDKSDACLYDLRAMFEDGHRVLRQRVDLCKNSRYVITDF